MKANYYTKDLEFNGILYKGRLSPKHRKITKMPSSWHVVLNGILFGYFHKNGGVLEVNEQRPAHLTEVLGQIINDLAYE